MDDSGWNWTVTAYVLLSAEIKCRYPSIFDAFSSVWLSNHLSVLFILPYHFLIRETCCEVSIDHIIIKGCEQIVRLMFVVLVASISSCRDGFGFVLEVCLFTNLHSKIAGWLSSKEVVGCSVFKWGVFCLILMGGISMEGCSLKFTPSLLLPTRVQIPISLVVLPSWADSGPCSPSAYVVIFSTVTISGLKESVLSHLVGN